MKLKAKIWLGAGSTMALILALDLYVGLRHIEVELQAQAVEDAQVVRALLMSTRQVYQQAFVASGLPINAQTVEFLPGHALPSISAQLPQWSNSGLRFNNVSERPLDPANAADPDERQAIEWLRSHPTAQHRVSEHRDAQGRAHLLIASPIRVEADCLRCHGGQGIALDAIAQVYANKAGYRLGELIGAMSIRIPLDILREKAFKHWLDELALRSLGYILLLVLLGTLMHQLVLRRLLHLETVTGQLACGDLTARAALTGSDEVTSLGARINDMAGAIAEHQTQVDRLNQIYAALSATNQAIVRINDEDALKRSICKIAVDLGGMTMAWIGRPDPLSGKIVSVEAYGSGLAYVAGLAIDLSPDSPESHGPTATAWMTRQAVVIQDYLSDPMTAPWHERAKAFGWRSAAAFPVLRGQTVAYTLNLTHRDPMAFDPRIKDLLLEMAMDFGVALDRIDLLAEQARTNAELAASEAKYRSVLETSHDGFWLVNRDAQLIEVNAAYARFSGYSRDELLTLRISDLEASEDVAAVQRHVERVKTLGSDVFETRHRTKGGEIKPVEVSTSVASEREGTLSVFIRDLSTRQEAEARIQRLSHFDTLTGLPNRALFTDMARQALAQATRNREPLALVFIDIDHFKNINDTLGHRVGDALLVELAARFQAALRGEDTLSRLGGDEFLLLLPRQSAADAAHVAERLIAASARSMLVEGHELVATASLGLALYPEDGTDFETLLQKADTATNRAKEQGRNNFCFFAPEMQQRSARTLQMESALRHALERNEFLLHYQPQIDLAEGRIIGMEALIRWRHPTQGMVSPAEFIPLAESSGLIVPIGEWVLKTALLELKGLIAQGLAVDRVAVNLSAVQFRQGNLPQRVAQILEQVDMPARYLELELTEGLAMENPQAAITMMDTLHQQGIWLSIDDFGTGYSSLSYLKRFRIDKLKIDQSFVRDLTQDREDEAIVEAIIKLADTLNFKTIAEGVETQGQLDYLRRAGCKEVQGYFFARPLPPEQLADWLRNWSPASAKAPA